MVKQVAMLAALLLVSGCGEEAEVGGLAADERERLENIADRLDAESADVRELLEADQANAQSEGAEPAAD